MKTFCVSLMALIAAFLCVPAAHASLSSPDASPSANDYTACRQRDGVKVCPACNGTKIEFQMNAFITFIIPT